MKKDNMMDKETKILLVGALAIGYYFGTRRSHRFQVIIYTRGIK